jgi:hypothetical protein
MPALFTATESTANPLRNGLGLAIPTLNFTQRKHPCLLIGKKADKTPIAAISSKSNCGTKGKPNQIRQLSRVRLSGSFGSD